MKIDALPRQWAIATSSPDWVEAHERDTILAAAKAAQGELQMELRQKNVRRTLIEGSIKREIDQYIAARQNII